MSRLDTTCPALRSRYSSTDTSRAVNRNCLPPRQARRPAGSTERSPATRTAGRARAPRRVRNPETSVRFRRQLPSARPRSALRLEGDVRERQVDVSRQAVEETQQRDLRHREEFVGVPPPSGGGEDDGVRRLRDRAPAI